MSSRKTALWLLSPVFLVVIVVAITLSPIGGRLAVSIANQTVPGLSIERSSGSLMSTLNIYNINYQMAVGSVSLSEVGLDLSLECLFEQKLCINHLTLGQLDVAVSPAEQETSKSQTAEAALVTLPVPLNITALSIRQLNVSTPSVMISASTLATSLQAYEVIQIPELAINSLQLQQLDSDQLSAPSINQRPTQDQEKAPVQNEQEGNSADKTHKEISYALNYQAPELSDIYIPVDAQISNLALPLITLLPINGEKQQFSLAATQIHVRENDVTVAELNLNHSQGQVKLDASANLTDAYSINADLSGNITAGEVQQNFSITTSGTLAELTLVAVTDGTYNAQLNTQINLLNNQLPLSIQATWPQQALPEQIELSAGTATIDGEMGDYSVELNSAIDHPKTGLTPIAGKVHITRDKLKLVGLNIDTLQGRIVNTGELRLDHRVTWQGITELNGLDLTSLLTLDSAAPKTKSTTLTAPTNISGELTSIVVFQDNKLDASIRKLSLSGDWQQQPLKVSGNVTFSSRSDIAVGQLTLTHATNSVALTGQVFKQRYMNIDALVNIADLHQLAPEFVGNAEATAKIVGDWSNPTLDITLTGEAMQDIANNASSPSEQSSLTFDFDAQGSLANHTIQLNAKQGDYRAEINANNGSTDLSTWQSEITTAKLYLANTQWQLLQPFKVQSDVAQQRVNIAQNCWQTRRQGQLCLDNINLKNQILNWQVNANGLPAGMWLHELAPEWLPHASSATLAFNSAGAFSLAKQVMANQAVTNGAIANTAEFSAQLSPATWQLGNDKVISIGLLDTSVNGQFKQGELTIESHIRTEQLGEITHYLYAEPLKAPQQFSMHTRLQQLNLTPLEPLSDLIRQLGGVINGDIRYTHTTDKPEIAGFLRIEDGAIDIQNAPVALKNWQQNITLLSDRAQFNGSFELGGGPGTLSGSLNWQNEIIANLQLIGENFVITPPDMTLSLSPHLNVAINDNVVKVTGDINIPRARIKVDELPDSAVVPSQDVHLRGEPLAADPLAIIDADVNVSIDADKTAQVRIDAFGLTANLHGNIGVKTLPALVGYGDLQILDGRYKAYGQDLFIQTGEVQFNGPLTQPFLLVEAIRDPAKTEDDVIAGVRIDGSASQPNVNLFSEPAMDQGANLAYLLNGRGPGADGGDTNYNALLLGFGLSSGESLTAKIGNTLGIDDFTVSTTSSAGGGDTKLALSGKINDRLSVQYNVDVGLNNGDEVNKTIRRRQLAPDLTVKYQLRPRLFIESIQTTIEEQTEFAVDLYYRFFVGEVNTKPAATTPTESVPLAPSN